MLRSRANEIPRLVEQLASRSRTRVDAARARLSVIGPRAVEELIEALEGSNNRIRARAMPLLALIQDPRGREPLVAMLLDRNARMRQLAAGCLGRFPAPDVVVALKRLLQRERRREVRVAAVQALVEQYAAGQECALARVLDLLVDPAEPSSIRLAASGLLRTLRPAQRRSILRRLAQDPHEAVRRRAEELAGAPDSLGEAADLRPLLDALISDDYAVWDAAVQRLGAAGPSIVRPLVGEMRRRCHDPEYCTRAGMALKALGPRRGASLADLLDEVDEPLPLQVLVEAIGAIGNKAQIYRLKDLIERVSEQLRAGTGSEFEPLVRVRAKAHLELARIGSRVAIRDLRDALADPDRRFELELVAAVEAIGKRDEIAILLQAHRREDRFVQRKIAEAVRAIMQRERIRRNDRMFQALGPQQRRALSAILPRAPERTRPRVRRPVVTR
jgi:HEAT repeat protein